MTPHVDDDFADPRLGEQLRRRDRYQGVFADPGALVRTPGGNVEDVRRYQAAGCRWLLLNLEHDPYDWATVIGRCHAVGMPWGWWFHCRTREQLEGLAAQSKRRPIVGYNVEKELETTLDPAVVCAYHDAEGTIAEPALITYGWVPNSVSLADVADWAVMLEAFPSDNPQMWDAQTQTVKWSDLEKHARAQGARHPQLLMQGYQRQPLGWGQPTWYPADERPRHVYCLDDVTGENGPVERWCAP